MTSISSDLPELIKKFRDRADSRRASAKVVLLLIVSVLALGILAFIFAGALAVKESGQDALLREAITNQKKDVDKHKSSMDARTQSIFQETNAPTRRSKGNLKQLAALHEEDVARDKELREYLQRLEQLQVGFIAAPNLEPTPNSYGTLVSSIATRIGSVVMLLFLVRILVPLYRYNIRMSSYYDGRADSLELLCTNKGHVDGDLVRMLLPGYSPDHIDFSEAPASPTQEVLDFMKQVLASKQG